MGSSGIAPNLTAINSLVCAPGGTMSADGLSEAEAATRRAQGQGNNVTFHTSRSYAQILWHNAITFINVLLFIVCSVLIWMGRLDDAVLTAGLVGLNVVVGVVQEGRAKRQLDRIALLTRPTATVVREGRECVVDPSAVVLGDVLVARPGDQIAADGQVLDGRIDADESLLTGESDLVPKRVGDAVSSGTFCVTGSARYAAGTVGAGSVANRMTASARVYRQVRTPLQRDVAIIIRVLVLLASLIGLLLALSFVLRPIPAVQQAQVAAVLVALVPQGLIALITVTYALGMVRLTGHGALVQRVNAVESLSHVDVLCMDKTGTLTTNRLQFHAVHALGAASNELNDPTRLLGDYVASISEHNRTAETIRVACAGQQRHVVDEVAFSSARKWGALACDDPALHGVYVLGAAEVLQPALHPRANVGAQGDAWAAQGLRVLLFAYRPDVTPLYDATGQPRLPSNLIPLALVSLCDELRPDVRAALAGFAERGVRLKVISGDHPQTVAALATQAGMGADLKVVSGIDLATMSDAAFARAADDATIFGRITPEQKERLVHALRDAGHYVAMIGDGVNDVLSLKSADLGIALHSGSQAARSVADMVLLNDAFGALPAAFREGQRIMNAMHDVMRLLLTRTVYVTLLIVGAAMVGVAFPVTPKHNSILGILTVGLPPLVLAIWARPGTPPRRLMHSVIHFVLPAAFTIAFVTLPVYLAYMLVTRDPLLARSALTTATLLCGLVLIPFVKPPTAAWVGGNVLSGDWRPSILAVGMLVLYGVILSVPFIYRFFGLTPLPVLDLVVIAAAVATWALGLRFAWRAHLFERFLGVDTRLHISTADGREP